MLAGIRDFALSVRYDAITDLADPRSEGNEQTDLEALEDEASASASVLMGIRGPSAGHLLSAAPRPPAAGAPLTARGPPGPLEVRPHTQSSQWDECCKHD